MLTASDYPLARHGRHRGRRLEGRRYDLVAIGGSAGGITALGAMLGALPASFPLPILVVQHLSATLPSLLPEVLGYRTPLRCKWAAQGDRLTGGTVYVGPPDRHLLVGRGRRVRLSIGPKEDWWRPAVNRLFESAAEICGGRVIAVVMSGMMWDGARGMAAVHDAGGFTIAQDAPSSRYFEMPSSAIDLAAPDAILPPAEIARTLLVLAELDRRG
jgi:two-component system chemotaxis response regulator CheB